MKTLCMTLRVSLPYLLALGCSIRAGSSISAVGGDGLFADLVVECLALLLVLGLALLLVSGLVLSAVFSMTLLVILSLILKKSVCNQVKVFQFNSFMTY